jgi:toxin-antitoxin system PIN domain toxin
MKLVDLNLLIYAVNRDAPHHVSAKSWWEEILTESEPVALSWMVILGFLRITTSGRIMPAPLSDLQALELVEDWLRLPGVVVLSPTDRHWTILRGLILSLGTAGNLTSDAHLAALAIEHGATLYSTDNDFSRFSQVRWVNPIDRSLQQR